MEESEVSIEPRTQKEYEEEEPSKTTAADNAQISGETRTTQDVKSTEKAAAKAKQPENRGCTSRMEIDVGADESSSVIENIGISSSKPSRSITQNERIFQADRWFSCSHCPVEYLSELYLIQHLKKQHHIEIACSLCQTFFINHEKLSAHMREVHKSRLTFICSVCKTIFFNALEFISHVKNAHK
jgi:transcription elongation factor Elf1